jgi:hypothetical protein
MNYGIHGKIHLRPSEKRRASLGVSKAWKPELTTSFCGSQPSTMLIVSTRTFMEHMEKFIYSLT